jgi:DNA-binding PadR family transcriptional regulator
MKPQQTEPSPEARKLIPFTPAVLFVLLSLASEAKHGYAVMQEVEQLSDGEVRMGPATLYTTIQRLSDLDLVSEVEPPAKEDDSRRRYYEISPQGRTLLNLELERIKTLLRRANTLLGVKQVGESR